MLRVKSVKQGLRSCALGVLLLSGAAGVAVAADASAPDVAQAAAPAAGHDSVQEAMALATKVEQQKLADKKKTDEDERLRGFGADWESWKARNSVSNIASLQRGARDFAGYCRGCHSLKYERYSRMAKDLQITPAQLQKYLLPAGAKPSDYVTTPMPSADAQTWFGKVPPDLSLIARSRGPDYLFRFLTTFYTDPTRSTGANNLQLASVAMPDVLATLEGVKAAVFRTVDDPGPGGSVIKEQVFDHFVQVAPGSQSHDQYLSTVRDLVNFLDYVGEPAQVQRRSLGVKVVLFLLAFTALTYLLKREYWKKIH